MLTFVHGNKKNKEAFSLLDSLISIFLTGITLIAICGLLLSIFKYSNKTIKKINEILETRNENTEKILNEE